ncbi:MAG TPA: response regulator transcription factor [Actinomycetota bacterium]
MEAPNLTCPIRVAVVDDHPVARWGIEHVFAGRSDIRVVASASSVEELEALGRHLGTDVVMLDLYLGSDVPAIAAIGQLATHAKVLVVSVSGRRADVLAAIEAGADGYLTKQADDAAFAASVRTVAGGGFYLSSQLAGMLRADFRRGDGPRRPRAELSAREAEALRYIAQGFTHAQAATRMNITEATISTYVKRVRQKLKAGNKADLTRRAMELGHLR